MANRGLVIAGLSSGSGKTTVTLGLLRALTRRGHPIAAAKCGPDYIDGAFLSAACGKASINLDSFAMDRVMLHQLAANQQGETLIVEGVMGLFDGTHGGRGSTAALADALGLTVILVIDCRRQAQTAAALAAGLATQLADGASLGGVILNHIASPRHEALIAEALAAWGIRSFGSLPTEDRMAVPSRHLGLVQAADLDAEDELQPRIDAAADLIEAHIDLDAILEVAAPFKTAASTTTAQITPPPGQRIAVAQDQAYGFAYHHMLTGWQIAGASIIPFSPLQDEAPDPKADFIFLPGGYPELHLGRLSAAGRFLNGLRNAASVGARIYGECGGYMTLGQGIIDADGQRYEMAGLLQLETSFAQRKLHLGYRHLTPVAPSMDRMWPGLDRATGHEFHYTTAMRSTGDALFAVTAPDGSDLGTAGLAQGTVFGSYAHIITADIITAD